MLKQLAEISIYPRNCDNPPPVFLENVLVFQFSAQKIHRRMFMSIVFLEISSSCFLRFFDVFRNFKYLVSRRFKTSVAPDQNLQTHRN